MHDNHSRWPVWLDLAGQIKKNMNLKISRNELAYTHGTQHSLDRPPDLFTLAHFSLLANKFVIIMINNFYHIFLLLLS